MLGCNQRWCFVSPCISCLYCTTAHMYIQSHLCSRGLSSCSTSPVSAYRSVPQMVSRIATLIVQP